MVIEEVADVPFVALVVGNVAAALEVAADVLLEDLDAGGPELLVVRNDFLVLVVFDSVLEFVVEVDGHEQVHCTWC